jgi:TetR/AcrR family transcriptional regulator, regulator of mycofactocin system
MMTDERTAPRIGRQPSTTVAELSHIGLRMFVERGFDETTVDEIAEAAGIGRRTFFRYFPSKNDLPWGDFTAMVDGMRVFLFAQPDEVELTDALLAAVLAFNSFPAEEIPYHRERMTLLLTVPSLAAHSTLRYAAWRRVVAEFAAARLGEPVEGMRPQTIAWALLAVCISAYEQWLRHDDADLLALLAAAFRVLGTTFDPAPHTH